METKRLGYFVRVAKDGSLTKASGVLRIAQPALSRQMRLLEEELGFALFHRSARGMTLTGEGEQLLATVSGPLRELEMAVHNSRTSASRIEGNITLGMPANISDVSAVPFALKMIADFPSIKIRIIDGPTGTLIDWLHRGVIDFAVLEGPSRNERLSDYPILSEPLMLVGPPASDLAPDRPVPFAKAARLPLILPSHHLGLREVVNEAAAAESTPLNIRFEADSTRLAMRLVVSGVGFAILPRSRSSRGVARSELRHAPISAPTLSLRAILSTRKGREDNRAVMKKVRDLMLVTIAAALRDAGDGRG